MRHLINLLESEATAHDGDAYFNMREADDLRGNPKSRETLVYMSPSDFLRMAEPGHSDDKEATVQGVLKAGQKFRSLPHLSFEHDGKGVARVIGHEGRHRARALQALGVQQMPVVLQSQASSKGPSIRWGSQRPGHPDHVPVMPRYLEGEVSGVMPMPQSVLYPSPQ